MFSFGQVLVVLKSLSHSCIKISEIKPVHLDDDTETYS